METTTKEHILSYEEPEHLRAHLAEKHPVLVVAARSMDHREMDAAHIAAHRNA